MGNSLIDAAISRDLPRISHLLSKGANLNFANRQGVTALMMAALWNRSGIVNLLLSMGADVSLQESSSGYDALMFASMSGNSTIVNSLLSYGASVNSFDINGRTPLMIASFCCHSSLVKILLEHGANIEAIDRFGSNALAQAISIGCNDVAEILGHWPKIKAAKSSRCRRTKASS